MRRQALLLGIAVTAMVTLGGCFGVNVNEITKPSTTAQETESQKQTTVEDTEGTKDTEGESETQKETEKETEEATPTKKPTPTPRPVVTPIPTATPVPEATATPVPTATVTPKAATPTPKAATPTPLGERQDWKLQFEKIVLEQKEIDAEYGGFRACFMDVTGDEIPEMFISTETHAGGMQMYTYENGAVSVNTLSIYSEWSVKEHKIWNTDGYQGYLSDEVLEYDNGWKTRFVGSYVSYDMGGSLYEEISATALSSDGRAVEHKLSSKQEYDETIAAYFDEATTQIETYCTLTLDDAVEYLREIW